MTTALIIAAIVAGIICIRNARRESAIRKAAEMSSAELFERNHAEKLSGNFGNIYGAEWDRRHGADGRGDV